MKTFVKVQGYDVYVFPEEEAIKFIKDPVLLESDKAWMTLADVGFPQYVIVEDGTVYKMQQGYIGREVQKCKRGEAKNLSFACYDKVLVRPEGTRKKELTSVTKQFFVHMLLAKYFLEKPEGSKRVGFLDGDNENISLDNLYWK